MRAPRPEPRTVDHYFQEVNSRGVRRHTSGRCRLLLQGFPVPPCFDLFCRQICSRRGWRDAFTWFICPYLRLDTPGINSTVAELKPGARGNPLRPSSHEKICVAISMVVGVVVRRGGVCYALTNRTLFPLGKAKLLRCKRPKPQAHDVSANTTPWRMEGCAIHHLSGTLTPLFPPSSKTTPHAPLARRRGDDAVLVEPLRRHRPGGLCRADAPGPTAVSEISFSGNDDDGPHPSPLPEPRMAHRQMLCIQTEHAQRIYSDYHNKYSGCNYK